RERERKAEGGRDQREKEGVLRHSLHQFCFLAGADITEVSTREGDDAILPCALDSPVNLKDEAFDWKKEPQEVFFYIKGKDYNNGREGQDPQFVNRVGLTQGGLQAGNASVVLSSVTQADSGVYKLPRPPAGCGCPASPE
uniref:Ig-like domain-containing protein n=1 Tax=Gadus morhua TaxID=8049 RepID=A0A8C5A0A5_GADMO